MSDIVSDRQADDRRIGERGGAGAPAYSRGIGGTLKSAAPPLVLLLIAFAFGGSSAGQPLRDMAVQIFAVILLALSALGWVGRGVSPDARIPLTLIAALAVLFIFQIIPLPAGFWSALGGRAMSADVLKLIGEPIGARPLSVQPEQTVLSALACLPGVAMAVVVMRLGTSARTVLAATAVLLAVLSLAFGVAQASLGSEAATLTLYRTTHLGLPLGVFANTNHQADLLLIGFVMAGVLAPLLKRTGQSWVDQPWWVYGVMAALGVGVVATGSRTGIALLGIALLAVVIRERMTGHTRLFIAGAIGLAVALALLIAFNPMFARSFADFSNLDDPRFHFWPNVTWAIGAFGLLGTGAGTFDGVYRSAETLDTLTASFINHAHNDYLEIMLEMGVPGILLLLAFIGFVGWRGVRIIQRTDMRGEINLAYGGMVCVGLLLLHSAVDYPLRTPLLSVVFGLCCAMMTRPPSGDTGHDIPDSRQSGVPKA